MLSILIFTLLAIFTVEACPITFKKFFKGFFFPWTPFVLALAKRRTVRLSFFPPFSSCMGRGLSLVFWCVPFPTPFSLEH